jgi:hypothetical protein
VLSLSSHPGVLHCIVLYGIVLYCDCDYDYDSVVLYCSPVNRKTTRLQLSGSQTDRSDSSDRSNRSPSSPRPTSSDMYDMVDVLDGTNDDDDDIDAPAGSVRSFSRDRILRKFRRRIAELRKSPSQLALLQSSVEQHAKQIQSSRRHRTSSNAHLIQKKNLQMTPFEPSNRKKSLEAASRLRDERIRAAKLRRNEREKARITQHVMLLEQRERARLDGRKQRKERQQTEYRKRLCQKWRFWIAHASRLQTFKNGLLKMRREKLKMEEYNRAATRIQRWIRGILEIKRREKARLYLKSLRTCVTFFALNHRAVKRHRAADILKSFLEQQSGVSSISRVIKNFRRRVLVIQKLMRHYLAVRRAKLETWRMQFDNTHRELKSSGAYLGPVMDNFRELVLTKHMRRLNADSRSQYPMYKKLMEKYHSQVRMRSALEMVSGSGNLPPLLPPPRKPCSPTCLASSMLKALVKEAARLTGEHLRNIAT